MMKMEKGKESHDDNLVLMAAVRVADSQEGQPELGVNAPAKADWPTQTEYGIGVQET